MKTERPRDLAAVAKDHGGKGGQVFLLSPGVNLIAMRRALGRNIVQMRPPRAHRHSIRWRGIEPKKRTYWGKVREMFRALQLEWKYSNEILQCTQQGPVWRQYQGVKAASVLYFKKNPDHFRWPRSRRCRHSQRPTSLVMGKEQRPDRRRTK